MAATSGQEHPAVTHFRNYLRINTMHPDPDYGPAVEFLRGSAKDVGLDFKVVEVAPGKPMAIMTWTGTKPELPSLMLHSHMDVVPVFPEFWKVDPFSAHKTESGDIIARGSQDMKCVGIQYLEAVRRLKESGKAFPRTIHLTFSPDEEVGSHPMKAFLQTKDFQALNAGFALDEGIASPGDDFCVFHAERSLWWVRVSCPGNPGHGSQFIENTAAEKIRRVINKFLEFRDSEEARLKNDPSLTLGHVTTINLTKLEGGVKGNQCNVVPAELVAYFDIRVTPTVDLEAFEKQIASWCNQAGSDVTYSFITRGESTHITSVEDSDPWWKAFSEACARQGVKFKPEIFPAGTDGRHTRAAGVPVIGFSPMNHTPVLLHDHNEFLNEKIFLRGIDIYVDIIATLASVPA